MHYVPVELLSLQRVKYEMKLVSHFVERPSIKQCLQRVAMAACTTVWNDVTCDHVGNGNKI